MIHFSHTMQRKEYKLVVALTAGIHRNLVESDGDWKMSRSDKKYGNARTEIWGGGQRLVVVGVQ